MLQMVNFMLPIFPKVRTKTSQGTQEAQSVKHPTLGFHSGHDLTVREFKPHIGPCDDSAEPAWDSLSPFLSAPPRLLSISLNKYINKNFKKRKEKKTNRIVHLWLPQLSPTEQGNPNRSLPFWLITGNFFLTQDPA